ncbi:hypothetical protein RND71_003228 [Anisodus tanguticus]|uniref:Uncharacterized protein n=1 Tax=Anisodus tanguticus TaxID=243964 RepID=A0AAE1SVI1_9SOLA|nr:hypothetical protein RND71_003228 [Anisodus tanguticus]
MGALARSLLMELTYAILAGLPNIFLLGRIWFVGEVTATAHYCPQRWTLKDSTSSVVADERFDGSHDDGPWWPTPLWILWKPWPWYGSHGHHGHMPHDLTNFSSSTTMVHNDGGYGTGMQPSSLAHMSSSSMSMGHHGHD